MNSTNKTQVIRTMEKKQGRGLGSGVRVVVTFRSVVRADLPCWTRCYYCQGWRRGGVSSTDHDRGVFQAECGQRTPGT